MLLCGLTWLQEDNKFTKSLQAELIPLYDLKDRF